MLIALVACLAGRAVRPDARLRDLVPVALAVAALVSCLSLAGAVWLVPLLLGALVAGDPRLVAGSRGGEVGDPRGAGCGADRSGSPRWRAAPAHLVAARRPGCPGQPDRGAVAASGAGIWPAGDFRVDPDEMSVTIVLCVFAGVAAVGGCAGRRPQAALGPGRLPRGSSRGCRGDRLGRISVGGRQGACDRLAHGSLRRPPRMRLGVGRAPAGPRAGRRLVPRSGRRLVERARLQRREPRAPRPARGARGDRRDDRGRRARPHDRVPALRGQALPAGGRSRGRFRATPPPGAARRRLLAREGALGRHR